MSASRSAAPRCRTCAMVRPRRATPQPDRKETRAQPSKAPEGGERPSRGARRCCCHSCRCLHDIEHAHPTELRELGLMGMKHVMTGLVILVRELDNAALGLALHDGINRP